MIQLVILSGSEAGKRIVGEKFPVKVGRASTNTLTLPDPGVFAEHFEISFRPEGFLLSPRPEAVITINGEPATGGILRNGDIIGAGLAKVQFWLGALPQRGLRARELFTWALLAGVAALQIYLFVRLLAIAR
jgi:hypothetical protein